MKRSKKITKPKPERLRALAAIREEAINYDEIPPLGPDFWAKARLEKPAKEAVTIRLDADLLKWYRSQGRGYQTKINGVLRHYYEAQRSQ